MKKGTQINNNIAISKRYEKALLELVDAMQSSTEKEINILICRKYAKTYFKIVAK